MTEVKLRIFMRQKWRAMKTTKLSRKKNDKLRERQFWNMKRRPNENKYLSTSAKEGEKWNRKLRKSAIVRNIEIDSFYFFRCECHRLRSQYESGRRTTVECLWTWAYIYECSATSFVRRYIKIVNPNYIFNALHANIIRPADRITCLLLRPKHANDFSVSHIAH